MESAPTLDVAPFPVERGAGDGGAHALLALLQFLGRKVDYPTLKAVSGDGYKFVYDSGPIYEPMRDLTPNDFVRDALAFFHIEGSWRTGHMVDELQGRIAAAIEAGWPVLTSNLLDPGYQLIVGYQDAPPRVAVLVARPAEPDGSLPSAAPRWRGFDADWDGPLSGRARWDLNPVFLISEVGKPANPKPAELLRRAIEAGLQAYEVYEIPYGTSGLDESHADEPLAGRAAAHGLDAWAALGDEAASRPELVQSFAFVWKVAATMQRLGHDRTALADFFAAAAQVKGADAAALQGLADLLRECAAGARTLERLVWNDAGLAVDTPEDYQQLLATTRSLAYPVPQYRGFPERLREMGYTDRIADTLWGEAIIMGDLVRWREVSVQIERLADLESGVESRLRRLAG